MKETHYKLKHRVTALFAAAVMLCSMLPGAAFAEEPTPQLTEETAQMEQQTEPSETDNGQTDESSPDPGEDVTEATPETAEEQPAEEEIPAAVVGAELYTDLPDAPIGSYIGSEGLPVANGETKIGISEWPESQLEEGGSYLTAVALDNDSLTMAAPLLDGADYAIVPIMAQVEYPANGSTLDLVLPDSVTLLDYYGAPAEDAESLLHNEYSETSAAVLGVYVQADANFTAQLVYTAPDGSTLTKTLQVAIDRNATAEYPFPDSEIAAFAERPTPAVTSGKITKVAKVNGTWLIWFNGEPAYCCTPGADGQPKNCPTYTYVNTSMVGADQYVPGDHYGNQYRIWGGLTQLSLGMQELPPVALSAEAPSLLDSCRTIYTDAQMHTITYEVEEVDVTPDPTEDDPDPEQQTEYILHLTVSSKTVDELAELYNFTQDQKDILHELLSDEMRPTLLALCGGSIGIIEDGELCWPLPGHTYISCNFGEEDAYGNSGHRGTDIPAPEGTPILAAHGGTVIISGWNNSYGNQVLLDNGAGLSTRYAHMTAAAVSAGETVTAGQVIGYVGNTGDSTGFHLHFEVMQNGVRVNPLDAVTPQ